MKNITSTSNGSTTKWKRKLIRYFEKHVKSDELSNSIYKNRNLKIDNVGIHLAVFTEPFFSLIFDGKKTIESRFSLNKVSPFQKVNTGDIVFVKKSGGHVAGFFIVGDIKYLHSPSIRVRDQIRRIYSKAIAAHYVNDFWESRKTSKYISLLEVSYVAKIEPLSIEKKDRTAWCVLKDNASSKTIEIWST
jgi:ASC-1-like (ASCH) protein